MRYKYETSTTGNYALLRNLARQNRNAPTLAEDVLWKHLRGKQLGCRFRRQHPIGDFIVDFVCLDCQLVVEVDGGYHFSGAMQVSDAERTAILEAQGFRVIRFTNEKVLYDTPKVINNIMININQLHTLRGTASPLLGRGRGEVL